VAGGVRDAQGATRQAQGLLLWVLAVLLFVIVPAIGADGLEISRVARQGV